MTPTNAPSLNVAPCERCTWKEQCGKLDRAGFWGCEDHCLHHCNPDRCDFTCPHNHRRFSERWAEVGGRGPAAAQHILPAPEAWPEYLAVFHGNYGRARPADTPWVAVPLAKLFRRRPDGELEPVARTAAELRERFGLRRDARVLATGIGPDRDIERLWRFHRSAHLGTALLAMGVEVVVAPNYSHFVYAPRTHYLWNRKRTLLFADRLGAEGMSVIPHLYAETAFDYKWWARFFKERPNLNAFSLELQTGDAEIEHARELAAQLQLFTIELGRPLHAFVAGGRHAIAWLAPLFPRLTIIENAAYMRTIKRRWAAFDGRRIHWTRTSTVGPIDALGNHNVRVSAESLGVQIAAARARKGKSGTAAA